MIFVHSPHFFFCNISNKILISTYLQSFFGFGQSADIEIKLDGTDTRKLADIKSDDGKKEKFYLYYDGESVTGQVKITFKKE